MKQQTTIFDEKTKFSFTYNNVWTIILLVVTVVGIYFGLDKRLTRIEDKVDYISSWTKEHQQQTTELTLRTQNNVRERDQSISDIKETIATIKSVLKIQ